MSSSTSASFPTIDACCCDSHRYSQSYQAYTYSNCCSAHKKAHPRLGPSSRISVKDPFFFASRSTSDWCEQTRREQCCTSNWRGKTSGSWSQPRACCMPQDYIQVVRLKPNEIFSWFHIVLNNSCNFIVLLKSTRMSRLLHTTAWPLSLRRCTGVPWRGRRGWTSVCSIKWSYSLHEISIQIIVTVATWMTRIST